MKINCIRFTAAAILAAALLTSCGGGTQLTTEPDGSPEFSLKVYEESYLDGIPADSFSIRSSSNGQYVIASIDVAGAHELRALCLELDYDPAELTPLAITRSSQLETVLPESGLLELKRLDLAGTVHYAHMDPTGAGVIDGDAGLLDITFLRQPMSSGRMASAPPSAAHSSVELSGSITSGKLEWYYRNRGDYDQNGEVNVADITPLGVKLGATSTTPGEPFDITVVEWQVDGDENGNINISDITPLGANIGNTVIGGYNVYASESDADYPDSDNSFTNGAGSSLIATVGGTPPLSEALNFGDKSTQHLKFEFVLPDPFPGKYFWVRPTDGVTDGVPSTLVGPLSVENIPLPVIESIDKLDVVIGDTIIVTGTGFGVKDGADRITLNDLDLEVISWTNTTITAKIPVGAGDGPLVVVTLRTSDPSTDEINVIPATPGQPDGGTV